MRIYVEADSITLKHMSGIGHATYEIIDALSRKFDNSKNEIFVVVPFGMKSRIKQFGWKNVAVRQLPPGYKYVNYLLVRTSFPFPVDLIYGRGLYIFPNYKNWYVPFSQSITFVHDIAYKLFPETTHPKNLVYLNANMERWLKRTDTIVSISDQSKREVANYFPTVKKRINTVYLAVNSKVFYPRPKKEIQKVLAKHGIGHDYFLIVGNIEPRKNIIGMLDAYKRYSDLTEDPASLVIIGGDGWKNESILKKIEDMKRQNYAIVRPPKYVEDSDLPALYSGARSLLQLSFHEGFGLPPLEAQACGTPVIASDIPVLHEILGNDGVEYVDPNNIDRAAQVMTRTQMYTTGRKSLARPDLNWDATVSNLLNLAHEKDRHA